MVGACLTGFLLSAFLFISSAHAQTLRIYHIDVEQAAATLFVAPGGKTLLVDSGKNGMGSRVKAAMDQAGATKVDYFVCTHYHEDHYGGIDDLFDSGVQILVCWLARWCRRRSGRLVFIGDEGGTGQIWELGEHDLNSVARYPGRSWFVGQAQSGRLIARIEQQRIAIRLLAQSKRWKGRELEDSVQTSITR